MKIEEGKKVKRVVDGKSLRVKFEGDLIKAADVQMAYGTHISGILITANSKCSVRHVIDDLMLWTMEDSPSREADRDTCHYPHCPVPRALTMKFTPHTHTHTHIFDLLSLSNPHQPSLSLSLSRRLFLIIPYC